MSKLFVRPDEATFLFDVLRETSISYVQQKGAQS